MLAEKKEVVVRHNVTPEEREAWLKKGGELQEAVKERAKTRGISMSQAVREIGIHRTSFYKMTKHYTSPETVTRIEAWLNGESLDVKVLPSEGKHQKELASLTDQCRGLKQTIEARDKTIRELVETNRVLEIKVAELAHRSLSLKEYSAGLQETIVDLKDQNTKLKDKANSKDVLNRARISDFQDEISKLRRDLTYEQKKNENRVTVTQAPDIDFTGLLQKIQSLREKQEKELYDEPCSEADLRQQVKQLRVQNETLELANEQYRIWVKNRSFACEHMKAKLTAACSLLTVLGEECSYLADTEGTECV